VLAGVHYLDKGLTDRTRLPKRLWEVLDVHTTTREESAITVLPTAPCSVVWSGGHSYVLEVPGAFGSGRWVGLDNRGRPLALSPADLRARGWTLTPY